MNRQSWSIVIFCYNEEGSVAKVVEDAVHVLQIMAPDNHEIIIINDGSTDGTSSLIEILKQKYDKICLINHEHNLGIGAALRSGYDNAKNENVCLVPADGQFDLYELLPYAKIPQKTFVSFHRIVKTSYSSYRNMLSILNRKVNRYFLGLNMYDVNWVKIYKLSELKQLDIKMQSSIIETEICAKLMIRSNSLIQVPSSYHPRTSGTAKGSSIKDIMRIMKELYSLIRIVKKFRKMHKSVL